MSRYLILAQSDVTGKALGKWLELLGEPRLKGEDDGRLIVAKNVAALDGIKAVAAFENLLARIEECLSSGPSGNMVVLVDTVRPDRLNALSEGGWDHLLAMLILSLPEVYWHFGMISGYPAVPECTDENEKILQKERKELRESWQKIESCHSLLALLTAPHRDSLFDPTALRNFVRCKSNEKFLAVYVEKAVREQGKIDEDKFSEFQKTLLPNREKTAASIDEEVNYALFHAFIAYRFGYRVDAVRSWALMDYLFHCPNAEKRLLDENDDYDGHGFHLLLEDVNLNFPDKPGRAHLSTFKCYTHKNDGEQGRAKHCNLLSDNSELETSRFRVIVTSGHSGADRDKMQDNIDFVRGYKSADSCEFVLKPVGGMFDLWTSARLFSRLDPRKGHETAGGHRGQAPGFHWPPEAGEEAEEAGGHSAPGKLMLIAHHLVRRADCMKDTSNAVEECIRGAVLATDALELLRYQTPTLALQALCLKHEFEVRAEVAFLGVGNHFALKPRLSELEMEVKVASRFFQKNRRIKAELDTLVSIGNRLMLIFREAGQFDEEMECLARIRKWHRKLRLRQVENPIKKPAQLVMYYAEWLLESPVRFVLAIFGWFLAFWLILNFASPEFTPLLSLDKHLDMGSASKAWNLFISNNPENVGTIHDFAINAAATAVGVFHLGVFISYLYSAVTRK